MSLCRRCGKSFTGDELYCEPCEEYTRQLRLEEYGVFCVHCGRTFMPGGFDRHKWHVYYRDGEHPRGRRVRL